MTAGEPLAELLRTLKAAGYRFVAVTPATHHKVITRPAPNAVSLRDIFGWNRPFEHSDLSADLLALLRAAEAVEPCADKLRSLVRVASLGDDLLVHSAFPTDDPDSVFFGPDSYRFARFITQHIDRAGSADWLVDMGAGSGAGAIAARRARAGSRTTLVDINARALRLAAINAEAAGIAAETLLADAVPRGAGLIVANPPYMMDSDARSYRDGGELLGGAVALDWVRQSLAALPPGGTMLLYTGVAYCGGTAPFIEALEPLCAAAGAALAVDELDPDVFGDELDQPAYRDVERIAVIGAVIGAVDGGGLVRSNPLR